MTPVSTNEKPDSQHVIELASVYFYSGTAPRVVSLKDCGLLTKSPVPGAFSAFYGYQSKQEGFMAARAYAVKNRLQFNVIDLQVKLDQNQNRLMMKPEDLPQHDFITFQRLSRSMMDKLQDILRKRLTEEGVDLNNVDLAKPQSLIMDRPELITSVMNEPEWEHLKLLAYPARVKFSEKPLTIGTVPHKHWHAIQEATSRLDPSVRISLEPPSSTDASHNLGEPVASIKPRTKMK